MRRLGRTLVVVSLGLAFGCRAEDVANAVAADPEIEVISALRIARGDPTIERVANPDGSSSYHVSIAIEPAIQEGGALLGPTQVTATLTSAEGRVGALTPHSVRRQEKEILDVYFGKVPRGFEEAELEIEVDGYSGRYRVSGLQTMPDQPRRPARVETNLGTIQAIGVQDHPRKRSMGMVGGIALQVPWTPGYIRRLRDVDIRPAYLPEGRSRGTRYVRDGEIPGHISNEGFGYRRWEASGHFDLLTVARTGDAQQPESPVLVAKAVGGKRWRIVPKGTFARGEEVQVRADGGHWLPIGTGWTFDAKPRQLVYRVLKTYRSVPFAVQADAVNPVSVLTPHIAAAFEQSFDYAKELDLQTTKNSYPAVALESDNPIAR